MCPFLAYFMLFLLLCNLIFTENNMETIKIVFWICLFIAFYTYVGYGLLLYVLIRLKRLFGKKKQEPELPQDEDLPLVTLMICAYNERDIIEEKMQNIRAIDYPKEKFCVMWVTDGSSDDSNELLKRYDDIKLVFSPERRGKAAAMQHGLSENQAPFVVFTDANTMLNKESIREIVRQFMDPSVSCVSGEKRVGSRDDSQTAAKGEGFYWKYESTLKRWDNELYSAMGAAGELFAVRMCDYREAPSNALLDDFMMSMLILRDGHRIAYTSKAYAMEYGSANMHEESKRKRRIAAGGLQSIWWLRELMNPLRHPLVSFQFISHRVLRWSITPFALLALIPLNIALVMLGAGPLYKVLLVLQAIFYCAAAAGWWLSKHGHKNKLLYIPYYFLFMNMNVFSGIRYLSSHKSSGVWEKAKRG